MRLIVFASDRLIGCALFGGGSDLGDDRGYCESDIHKFEAMRRLRAKAWEVFARGGICKTGPLENKFDRTRSLVAPVSDSRFPYRISEIPRRLIARAPIEAHRRRVKSAQAAYCLAIIIRSGLIGLSEWARRASCRTHQAPAFESHTGDFGPEDHEISAPKTRRTLCATLAECPVLMRDARGHSDKTANGKMDGRYLIWSCCARAMRALV